MSKWSANRRLLKVAAPTGKPVADALSAPTRAEEEYSEDALDMLKYVLAVANA